MALDLPFGSGPILSLGDAIALTGRVTEAQLAEALGAAADPALPVGDFCGNTDLHCDFAAPRADAQALADFERAAAPIRQRLAALPFRARHEERPALLILRLA